MISVYFVRREYGAFQAMVDPMAIRYAKQASEWPRYLRHWPWLVCPGNWDETEREHAPFREGLMRQLFVEGRHYTETDVYPWLMRLVEEGGHTTAYPCGSREEIVAYFEHVERLGNSIKAHGVVPPSTTPAQPRDGITVRVGRGGSLLKCKEGTHRLAIARALELRRVPVIIDLVHPGWVRREVAGRTGNRGRRALEEALACLGV
jgi:hypothetical protein